MRLALATGLGLGFVPVAPGTAGSLGALAIYAACHRAWGVPGVLAGLALALVAGLSSAAAAERHFGRRDPGPVVVDELAGQMLALGFLEPTWPNLIAGFVLFRLLDVIKPPPARRVETLRGASGIMADDLVAAAYAACLLHLLRRWAPGLLGAG